MTAAETPRTDERATLSEAEEQAWEELWETDAARCCSCPSCNFYAPDYEQHGGEPCILRTLIERIVTDRLAAAVARAEAAEAKVDEVLRRIGSNLAQQHMAAERHQRAGLDDRHHYSEYHRMTQGRWAFYESARLLCQETRRDFDAFLSEHDPRHKEYDR